MFTDPHFLQAFLLSSIIALNVAVGVLILLKRPRHVINLSFFLFVSGMAAWMSGIMLLYATHDFLYDKLALGGGLLMLFGMALFARAFPSGEDIPPRFFLVFIPLAIAAALLPFDVYVKAIESDADALLPVLGPLFPLYALIAIGYLLLSAFLFRGSFRNAVGKQRMQMLYLLVGIAVFAGVMAACNVLLPALGVYRFNLFGPAASLIFVTLTAYAIVRHQLMDVRIVIQRGLIYSVLFSFIIAVYVLLISAFGTLFGSATDTTFFMSAVMTTVAGIFGAPHLEKLFRKATDRIFFKDRYDYACALHALSEILHRNVEFEDLVRESERELRAIFRASAARITLGPAPEDFEEGSRELSVPIELEGEAIGCILMGRKRSGDSYSPEDIQLLSTFAYQAATALSRARLYAEVRTHAEELEGKVAARTRELSDARERERQMLNDISHNLQTPLAVLQTRLDLLKRTVKESREIRSFEQSLAGFSSFIYDLLSLARLESDSRRAEDAVCLSALVDDLAEEIGVIAEPRGIRVESSAEPGLYVTGDERSLREALMNIASNALAYMREDGAREVRFSLAREGDAAALRIADTGIGIPEDELPRIFERFYRGTNAPGSTGTGLGLAIARRIIEQSGGMLAAASRLNEGTEITIHFPLLKGEK